MRVGLMMVGRAKHVAAIPSAASAAPRARMRLAQQQMGNQAALRSRPILQRTCACARSAPGTCSACKIPDMQHAVAAAERGSSGAPLPHTLMRKFEGSLGSDLSGVRIHTGGASERAAEAVGALAYTTGNHIHFGRGRYEPASTAGQHLLAHEIAHTVQQSGSTTHRQFELEVSSPGDPLEQEADRAADAMVSGASAIVPAASAGALVQRQVHRSRHGGCTEPVNAATSTRDYVRLVGAAEQRLRIAGWSTERIVHGLTAIYYGSRWSRDFNVEHSATRNAMFEQFTGAPFGGDVDPRAVIGCGLYWSLFDSQDVEGIDLGHALIGTDARMHLDVRTQSVDLAHYASIEHPTLAAVGRWLGNLPIVDTRATGLQISTWVGDLGAAAARLAADRNENSRGVLAGDIDRWFREARGDFGAPSNLRGDVLSYTIGDTSTAASRPTRPSLSTAEEYAAAGWQMSGTPTATLVLETPIAAGLARAFRQSPVERCARFLRELGGTGPAAEGTGPALTNRQAVLDAMVTPIEAFGERVYSLRTSAPGAYMHQAAVDVATRFLDQLCDCVAARGPLAIQTARGRRR
jgi:hypothetical protein